MSAEQSPPFACRLNRWQFAGYLQKNWAWLYLTDMSMTDATSSFSAWEKFAWILLLNFLLDVIITGLRTADIIAGGGRTVAHIVFPLSTLACSVSFLYILLPPFFNAPDIAPDWLRIPVFEMSLGQALWLLPAIPAGLALCFRPGWDAGKRPSAPAANSSIVKEPRHPIFGVSLIVATLGAVVLLGGPSAMMWHTLREAEADDASAQYRMGLFRDGSAAGIAWYIAAANQGYTPAMEMLADAYHRARGTHYDDAQAAQWLMRAADRDDALPDTLYFAALRYHFGAGVDRNEDEAKKFVAKAQAAGLMEGQVISELMQETGTMGDAAAAVFRRYDDKLHVQQKATPEDLNSLAILHCLGLGMPLMDDQVLFRDDAIAPTLFELAQAYGNLSAYYNEAELLDRHGIVNEATDLFYHAADNGHVPSELRMADRAAEGKRTQKDFAVAYSWYLSAAHNGSARGAEMAAKMAQQITSIDKLRIDTQIKELEEARAKEKK
jgi:TPR repeat protein